MSERDVITATERPATRASITADLRALGIDSGDVLVVHTSMSTLGYVVGGPHAVVEALLDAVGPSGTLTMPGHSSDWSDPAQWQNPPVPEWWWPILREHMPAFDPHLTPTRQMGAVVETFHRVPGVQRSQHPMVSHLAFGPQAPTIIQEHSLADGFGERSPLARLYDLDAVVVLIGVGHANNTSLHLAEHRADWQGKQRSTQGAPVLVDGVRTWVTFDDVEIATDDFEAVGAAFAATGAQRVGAVGAAVTSVMSQRALVDFAAEWFGTHRPASLAPSARPTSRPDANLRLRPGQSLPHSSRKNTARRSFASVI